MSRTSWRGIRFGYRGDKKNLRYCSSKNYSSFISLGIYGSWMAIIYELRLKQHLLGSAEFKYGGRGGYFVLNLKGYF
ncbi:MAG: hypothetical protein IPK10_20435 [Bacteroidetes bacterium]|nr:hypothetical protein [Bacteroidota bacterium]